MSTAPLFGEFGEINFAEVVQLCARVRSTGTLIVYPVGGSRPVGTIAFEAGEIVDGRVGNTVGLEAVQQALRLTEGTYRFDSGIRCQQRRIFSPLAPILTEALKEIGDPTISERPSPSLAEPVSAPAATPTLRRRVRWALPLAAVAFVGVGIAIVEIRETGRANALAPALPASPAPMVVTPLLGTTSSQGPQGITDTEISFGMAAPFTGPSRELGRQMKLGVEAAFAEVNDRGGVHGRRLRLLSADDGYEPTRTIAVMKGLRDADRVFGIVGNVGTPTAVVALPMALERKMLFYGAFTGASLLRQDPPDRYVFNFRASYAEETAAVVSYLVKVRRIRPEHIVVFAQDDAFGDAGYAGVQRSLRALRPELKNPLRLGYKRNTIDVTDALVRLRERNAPVRAVVMVATYRAAAKLIEKVRETNASMLFTNVSFVGSTALASELLLLGPRFAKGVIVTQVVPPVPGFSTAALTYKRALEAFAPREAVDFVSAEGYWSGRILIEALRLAGPKLDTEALVDAFETIHGLDLGIGTPITFGMTEHQGSHKVWGTQLDENGRYQPIELE